MEKDFAPYEIALRMKQLGFDEPCFGYYNEGTLSIEFIRNGNIFKESEDSIYFKENTSCLAPTFSQAFRWFRDVHKLHGYIASRTKEDGVTLYIPNARTLPDTLKNGFVVDVSKYEPRTSHDEALIVLIEQFCEIVEKQK